jgi:diaminopimelate decarboxylase
MIYGNLCMEHDKILSRKIELPENIDIWDMLIFVNTAWYFSDFSDSEPIKHNERKTIIVE